MLQLELPVNKEEPVSRTPLFQAQLALGAKMINFHGWEMPLHFGSQLLEHEKVRLHAGIFDVSHMNIVDLIGDEAGLFLNYLLTASIDSLPSTKRALYTCICNEEGGIIDDLIVYGLASDRFRLVFNAATRTRVNHWLSEQIKPFKAQIQMRPELAMIAIQGPKALALSSTVLGEHLAEAIKALKAFAYTQQGEIFIARTGYTGEAGLEIIGPDAQILDLWKAFLDQGVQACGLAARDSLRIEAGLLLNGQDMDEQTSPLESNLESCIHWEPANRAFIGRQSLEKQKRQGSHRRLVGLTLTEKAILRTGQKVMIDGLAQGVVTSGSFSPSLGQSIGFARVPQDTPKQVMVQIRNKLQPAKVGPLKFLNKGRKK